MTTATLGDGLTLGVRMLDRDHSELSEVLLELQSQITMGKAQSVTSNLLSDLSRAMRSHFALEEGMMAASRFPGMAVHQLRHQWMMEQMKALSALTSRGALILNEPLLILFSESHFAHLYTEDVNLGLWLNQGS